MKEITLREWAATASRDGILALLVRTESETLLLDRAQLRKLPNKKEARTAFRLVGRHLGMVDSHNWVYPTATVTEEILLQERYDEIAKIPEPIWGIDSLTRTVHRRLEPLPSNHSTAYKEYHCLDCGQIRKVHINGIYVENESIAKHYWGGFGSCRGNESLST